MENDPFIADLPIKDGDFPWLCGCLPEGTSMICLKLRYTPQMGTLRGTLYRNNWWSTLNFAGWSVFRQTHYIMLWPCTSGTWWYTRFFVMSWDVLSFWCFRVAKILLLTSHGSHVLPFERPGLGGLNVTSDRKSAEKTTSIDRCSRI